jgi:hypothetical protein
VTIMDGGRVEVDDDTLARGRELVAGGRMPSKRELQKHLGKRWEVVNEVLTRLGDEARASSDRKRREARQSLRRLSSRKRSGSTRLVLPERQRTVNEVIPISVPEPVASAAVVAEPLTVGKHPEPVAEPTLGVSTAAVRKKPKSWPLILLMFPASVAIWGGWVDLGRLTGFGMVHPFPGIPMLDAVALNMAITLPIGLEAYAGYALAVWFSRAVPRRARRFAMWSAIGSLALGAAGQVAYHLMVAAGMTSAPWQITTVVACLPVAVLGMGAALRHLVHADDEGA